MVHESKESSRSCRLPCCSGIRRVFCGVPCKRQHRYPAHIPFNPALFQKIGKQIIRINERRDLSEISRSVVQFDHCRQIAAADVSYLVLRVVFNLTRGAARLLPPDLRPALRFRISLPRVRRRFLPPERNFPCSTSLTESLLKKPAEHLCVLRLERVINHDWRFCILMVSGT